MRGLASRGPLAGRPQKAQWYLKRTLVAVEHVAKVGKLYLDSVF